MEAHVAFAGLKEAKYSMLHHVTGNTRVDTIPFSREPNSRSARKLNEDTCIIRPVTMKYVTRGNGIILHQMIIFTSDIASVINRNPFSGF